MNSQPLVSVVVPVYNVEQYLGQCLESILAQTHTNLEVIIVDDGSTDGGGKLCDEFAKSDTRVKVVHQKNKGLSGARNTGLKLVSGEYLAFVDSDDWIEPEMFSKLVTLMHENELAVIECGIAKTNKKRKKPKNISLQFETYNTAIKRIIKNNMYSVWRRVYKTDLIQDYRFLEGKTSEDVYFTIDNLKKVEKIGVYLYPFYNYRYNPTSITKSPYSLKKFDSLDAGYYVVEQMEKESNDAELLKITYDHMLKKLVKHYKLLNYNPHVDPDYNHRKRLKQELHELVAKNFSDKIPYLKLAVNLPIKAFEILIRFNKLRHNLTQSKVG